MEENECLNNIIKFCKREREKAGWFIFNDHNISFEKVRLLKDYEKDANLALPKELASENYRINYVGIEFNNALYEWTDISCLLIKNDVVPSDFGDPNEHRTDKYLVFCLESWEIIQIKINNPEQYSNLLGHFIQQYKSGIGK